MKKTVIGILLIILTAALITGCTQKQDPKQEKEEQTPKTEDTITEIEETENDGITEAFTKVLETKDTLEIKEFILENIQKINQETAEEMVAEYEFILNENYNDLFQKCNSPTYFTSINETKDKDFKLHIENIKDENIKKEVNNMVESGYTFEMLEGDYYLAIDYVAINDNFSEYLSDSIKPYYELRKKEAQESTFAEECLRIDFEELKNRAVTLEKVIRDNKEFKNMPYLKDMMKTYIQGLLSIGFFHNTADYQTGKVNETVKNTYKELKESDLKLCRYAAEEMDKILIEYEYTIKPDNQEANDKVNALKLKIADEVTTKVDEYLLEK